MSRILGFIASFFGTGRLSRSISLESITHITISEFPGCYSFIIHIPDEYDYILNSGDRDRIISCILSGKSSARPNSKTYIWFVDEIELYQFARNELMHTAPIPSSNPDVLHIFICEVYDEPEFRKLLECRAKLQEEQRRMTSFYFGDNPISEQDFTLLRLLSRRDIYKLILFEHRETKKQYIGKVTHKADLIMVNQLGQMKKEREALMAVNHEFVISLHFIFHSSNRIYFMFENTRGGFLLNYVRSRIRLSERE